MTKEMQTYPEERPQIAEFSDVTVFPNKIRKGSVMGGGPLWPDWEQQIWPRHCRNNAPVDKMPIRQDQETFQVDEPLIWTGHAHSHFGHFVAEYSTRILQSKSEGQGAKLLFGTMPDIPPNFSWSSSPKFFRDIIEWYGLSENDISFCSTNILAKTLLVAPQGEQMGKIRSFEKYIDQLDENMDRNALVPLQCPILYISRSRLPPYLGGHAGALYLDKVLLQAGVTVIYPEQLPLRKQLSNYLGAGRLVFSEGSALHCLQLLGRGLGEVFVVNRRTGRNKHKHDIAGAQLLPRCKSIENLEPIERLLQLYRPNGDAQVGLGIAVYDVEKLYADFEKMDVKLKPFWQSEEYESQRDADILLWLETNWHRSRRHLKKENQARFIEDLIDARLGHLVSSAKAILAI